MNQHMDLDDVALAWGKQAGLLPAVVQDAATLRVLMLGYMSPESLRRTLDSGRVCFFSRSRQSLWTKGESSGNWLELVSIEPDCDGDTLLVQARAHGPTCHLQRCSCFPTAPGEQMIGLEAVVAQRGRERPEASYTARLLQKGLHAVAQKVGEEGVETAMAGVAQDDAALRSEAADLLFHLVVLLHARGVAWSDVMQELARRHQSASTGAGAGP